MRNTIMLDAGHLVSWTTRMGAAFRTCLPFDPPGIRTRSGIDFAVRYHIATFFSCRTWMDSRQHSDYLGRIMDTCFSLYATLVYFDRLGFVWISGL